MDASGLVIGVVQAKLDAISAAIATGDIPQNVNFAISLDVLAKFLSKNRVPFRDGPMSTPLETARVAELAQSFTYRVLCERKSTPQAPVVKRSPKALEPEVTKRGPTDSELSRSRAEVIQRVKEARAGAEKLLAVHETERKQAAEEYESKRELYYQGLVAKNDVLQAEKGLAAAMIRVDEDKRWIAETDKAIIEYSKRLDLSDQ